MKGYLVLGVLENDDIFLFWGDGLFSHHRIGI